MRHRLVAHLRGIPIPSRSTGLRGRLAQKAVFSAIEMDIEADNHLQLAAAYATLAPSLNDQGARSRTVKDLFRSLEMAKCLRGYDVAGIKEMTTEPKAIPQEHLYMALKKAGLVGLNAKVAVGEEK